MLWVMWTCPNCRSVISVHCARCWVCFNGNRDTPNLVPDQADSRFSDPATDETSTQPLSKLCCLRCHSRMRYLGLRRLEVDSPLVAISMRGMAETLADSFDLLRLKCRVYTCGQCGHIELMLPDPAKPPVL